MTTWQLHSHHDNDIREILKDSGCLDSKGQIRIWKGKEVNTMMAQRKHTSLKFEECECQRGKR